MKRVLAWTAASLLCAYACNSEPESSEPEGSSARGGTDQGGEAGAGAVTSGGTVGKAGNSGSTSGGTGGSASGAAGRGGTPGGEGGEGDGAGSGGAGGDEGPDAVNVPAAVSGSRLRARLYEGSDGSRHLIGLHDTELGVDCEFADLGSGGFRCAPLAGRAVTQGVFLDDQCQVPGIGYETACGALPYFVASTAGQTCDSLRRLEVSAVGMTYPGSFEDTGSCAPYTAAPGTEWHATSPVAPEIFVAGTLEWVELGEGLSLFAIAGADGSRQAHSFWLDGRACSVVELTDGGRRCAPGPAMNLYTLFADDQCTTELGYTFGGNTACDDPSVLPVRRALQSGGCTTWTTTLAEVTRFTGTTVYTAGACASTMVLAGALARWAVGAPVEPSELPALSLVNRGTSRLRSRATQTTNGSVVELSTSLAPTLFDTALGETCTPKRFEDGVVRCTPSGPGIGFYYSDPDCTVPVLPTPSQCSPVRFALDERENETGCSEQSFVSGVYELGEAQTGIVYFGSSDPNQDCLEASLPEGFITLEPVAPSELVTLTEVLE